MNEIELRAKVIALETAVQAVLLTRAAPSEAQRRFTDIWTDSVRTLNRASPDNQPLTQAIQVECGKLEHYFRDYSQTKP